MAAKKLSNKPAKAAKKVVTKATKGAKQKKAPEKKKAASEKAAVAKPRSELIVATGTLRTPTADRPYSVERAITDQEMREEYRARKPELDAKLKHAVAVLRQNWGDLYQTEYGNLTGYNVGFRTKRGLIVSPLQVAIFISVADKVAPEELTANQTRSLPPALVAKETEKDIPPHLLKLPVCVKVRKGNFKLLQAGGAVPLSGGAKIRAAGSTKFGTLGACVPIANNKFVGVTAQHLPDANGVSLAKNSIVEVASAGGGFIQLGTVNNAVNQPGPGGHPPFGQAAVDAASIEFEKNFSADESIQLIGGPIYYPADFRVGIDTEPLPDASLRKFGAGSGKVLTGSNLDPESGFQYGGQFFSTVIRASGNPINQGGDSGCLLIMDINLADGTPASLAIGVVVAAEETVVQTLYACHMIDVLTALNITPARRIALNDGWTPV